MPRSSPPPSYPVRLRVLARTGLGRVLLTSLLAGVVFLGVGTVVRQARAYTHGLVAYRLKGASIHFVDLPTRLGPLVQAVLTDPLAFRLDLSVFDPDAERKIRDVVAAHPMVEAVKSVEIVYPCRADVRITLRRPAAWFYGRWADGSRGWLLVSSDQRRLDPQYYRYHARHAPFPMPRIVGVSEFAPTHAGQRWIDMEERVAEGLAAAGVARQLYRDFGGRIVVERIEVSRFPASAERRHDGEVRLTLKDGRSIEWGRTERNLRGATGEDGYAVKRTRLERELIRTRRRPHARIDVRYPLAVEGRGR